MSEVVTRGDEFLSGPETPLRLLISAGEVSGDRIGALLAKKLRSLSPATYLYGCGGTHMSSAGVEVFFHSTRIGAVGLVELIASLPLVLKAFLKLRHLVRKNKPDVAVLIACEGFNVPVAWWLRRIGVPTISYFPPQIWMWRRFIRHAPFLFDVILASFPEEFALFQETRSRVIYVGHYLRDVLNPVTEEEKIRTRSKFGLDQQGIVLALLPGSRSREVRTFCPILFDAAIDLRRKLPNIHFVVPPAEPVFRGAIKAHIDLRKLSDVVTLFDKSYDALRVADMALVASGTASLETALLGLPQIIFYRMSWVTYTTVQLLRRCKVLEDKMIGLPNLILGQKAVPELLQHRATAGNLAKETLSLLGSGQRRAEMREQFGCLRESLGSRNALENAARIILQCANESNSSNAGNLQ